MIYSTSIDDLRPDVAENCRTFVSLMAAAGYKVQIVNTLRDQEKQTQLHNTIGAPSLVTFHGKGLAFDICEKGYGYSRPEFFAYARKILTMLGFSPVKGEESHSQWDNHGKVTGKMILAGTVPPPMEAFMIPENQVARDAHNVTAWHKAGHTGSRARVAMLESKSGGHGYVMWFTFNDFAPDCDLICLPDIDGGTYAEKILKNNINIAFRSLMGMSDNLKIPEVAENCFLLQAIGNTDDRHYSENLDLPYWHGSSACAIDFDIAGYSQPCHNNLCAAIGTVYIRDKGSVISYPDWGSSQANARIAAMLALVDDKAIAIYGKPLTPEAKEQFVIDHSVNPHNVSKERVGNGIFVLPSPDIDLSKYIEGDEMATVYKTINDVPEYWRKDIRELLDCGAINGGTPDPDDVNLEESVIKAVIIMKRYMDSK